MNRDPGAPQARPALAVLRGGTGTEPGTGRQVLPPAPVPETSTGAGTAGTGPVLAPAGTVVPLTVPARAGTALRYCAGKAYGAAAGLWLHPGRAGHALWHGRPESAAGHFAYMKSREWVPEELTGKKAGFVAWAGFAYHVLIAWPLMWVSQAGIWALQAVRAAAVRPLFLLCLAVPVITILFILGII